MSWRQWVEEDPEQRDLELSQGCQYYNRHVPLVLQCGPTCGIALLTSLILKRSHTEDVASTAKNLLQGAISLGLSKSGEIMCPQYMSQLCDLAGIQHQITRVSRDSDDDVISMLRDSDLMIIYDKDKNNEPSTEYGGERAHWLLITGFCYKTPVKTPVISSAKTPSKTPINSSAKTPINSKTAIISKTPVRAQNGALNGEVNGAGHSPLPLPAGIPLLADNSFTRASARHSPDSELHVFVQHGKSRLRQLWRWRDILDSNESVRQPKPGDWVVPENFHSQVAGTVVRVPVMADSDTDR